VHAIAEQGVPTREIAEAIGGALGVPAQSVAMEDVDAHFGFLGRFFGMDVTCSSAWTRETLGWEPTEQTLIEDLHAGNYTS
jgi:nucleoside-diphosphate-sugar epimerase